VRTVFFDVDTQMDFLYPAGALYVAGAEQVVGGIAALNRFAGSHGIPVVSTMDAHAEDDLEFRAWPPHCVAGAAGQRKPEATLLGRRIVVRNVDVPDERDTFSLDGVQQILLEKQTFDCFTNVNLPGLLERLEAERYVVYGVVTEICVKFAVWGLLKTRKRVELVADAVRSLNDAASAEMVASFIAAGGIVTNVSAATRT
jgi:nicotinamidase/pyrazinamidase